jgi:predicted adenine nucleotide alpha hydrolase (AANH) superfamily ATPase
MSSFIRRMQRVASRTKPSGIPQFGTQVGVSNPKDKPRVNASKSKKKAPIPAGSYSLVL